MRPIGVFHMADNTLCVVVHNFSIICETIAVRHILQFIYHPVLHVHSLKFTTLRLWKMLEWENWKIATFNYLNDFQEPGWQFNFPLSPSGTTFIQQFCFHFHFLRQLLLDSSRFGCLFFLLLELLHCWFRWSATFALFFACMSETIVDDMIVAEEI